MRSIFRTALASTCLAGLGLLAACNQSGPAERDQSTTASSLPLPPLPASLPLQPGPATAVADAPEVTALPAASRPALARLTDASRDYAYLDRAASYDDVFFDAPPDYAFDYDGVAPWGWEADDGSIAYAEPIDDGYRYYYYQSGYDTPYLVRDPYYSYAFDGPALVAIYDRGGRMLPPRDYGPRWDYAGRYFARAHALRNAAKSRRRGVIAANWAVGRPRIAESSAAWDAARARDAAWTAYHQRAQDQTRAHWQADRQARVRAAQRFARYQRSGFQRPPPDFGGGIRPDRDRREPGMLRQPQVAHGQERLNPTRADRYRQQPEAGRAQEDLRRQAAQQVRMAQRRQQDGQRQAMQRRQAEQVRVARDRRMDVQRRQAEQRRQLEQRRHADRARVQRAQQAVARDGREQARRQQDVARRQQRQQRQQFTAQRQAQQARRQQQVVARQQEASQRQQRMAARREQQAQHQRDMAGRQRQEAQRQQQMAARQQQQQAQRQRRETQRARPQPQRQRRGDDGGGPRREHGHR